MMRFPAPEVEIVADPPTTVPPNGAAPHPNDPQSRIAVLVISNLWERDAISDSRFQRNMDRIDNDRRRSPVPPGKMLWETYARVNGHDATTPAVKDDAT